MGKWILYTQPNYTYPKPIQTHIFDTHKGPFGLNLLLLKLKTENWKHYSKIIFKCVNSIVGLVNSA